MNYVVEYKSIFEIVNLINENSKIKKNVKIEESEVEMNPIIIFDIIIIKDDDKTLDVLCSDKKTLDRIYYFSSPNMCLQRLTQLYKCFIINYSDIINVMKYKEFCNRYSFKKRGVKDG
ncbi:MULTISPECIES: hypothetical protein [Clostridium]|uniref:Uncharacterized protein n=1 Tax=Clostridium frigoriphilum TaxID=443253 RepID=A0ABU7UQ00_9CLOT|nr:hypothetical protein [Clostridium sp. DSM 17811]MBU3100673.1 hypothetical protein [Clostridium sp. DSM 17811]